MAKHMGVDTASVSLPAGLGSPLLLTSMSFSTEFVQMMTAKYSCS